MQARRRSTSAAPITQESVLLDLMMRVWPVITMEHQVRPMQRIGPDVHFIAPRLIDVEPTQPRVRP